MKTRKSAKKPRFRAMIVLMLAVGIGGSTFTSCRDNAIKDLSPEESQVFITNYDRTANFGQYRTFSLPDSVIVQSNNQVQTSGTAIEQRFLTNVANALISRGYTRVRQNPDLGVAVIRVNETYTGVASSGYSPYLYDYWYGGFGGYGGYGGYSPYYPSYYSFYQVSDNYWSVQIVDLKNRPTTGTTPTDPNQTQLSVIYDAEIRGDGIFDESSVDQAVNAIFSQSPYLKVSQ